MTSARHGVKRVLARALLSRSHIHLLGKPAPPGSRRLFSGINRSGRRSEKLRPADSGRSRAWRSPLDGDGEGEFRAITYVLSETGEEQCAECRRRHWPLADLRRLVGFTTRCGERLLWVGTPYKMKKFRPTCLLSKTQQRCRGDLCGLKTVSIFVRRSKLASVELFEVEQNHHFYGKARKS